MLTCSSRNRGVYFFVACISKFFGIDAQDLSRVFDVLAEEETIEKASTALAGLCNWGCERCPFYIRLVWG